MKKVVKRIGHEGKEFLKLFMLGYIPCFLFLSLFLTLKGLALFTALTVAGFFVICVVCYILQTCREKRAAKKAAKLKRSEI